MPLHLACLAGATLRQVDLWRIAALLLELRNKSRAWLGFRLYACAGQSSMLLQPQTPRASKPLGVVAEVEGPAAQGTELQAAGASRAYMPSHLTVI
jgi:hypothetical protein